jgi:hypothetical protein
MHESDRKNCFVIGPMRDMERLSLIINEIIQPLVAPLGYRVVRPGLSGGDILDFIMSRLDTAELLIADLTGNNPNVMYELGVRHCLGTPYVSIKEADDDAPPFDIAAFEYVPFTLPEVGNQAQIQAARDALQPAIERQHEILVNEEDVKNPVTNFYRAPLTEVSPAAGLALGYYQNMVYLSLEQIRNPDNYIKIDGEPITDEQRRTLRFEIVNPARLYQATHKYINDFLVQEGHLLKASVERPPRDITLYARPDLDNGIRLVDIPTTMNVMKESIKQRVTQMRPDHESEEWRTLEAQEIERFQSALRRLIRNEEDRLVHQHIDLLDWDFPAK